MTKVVNGIAFIATLAGLAYTVLDTMPTEWNNNDGKTWLFHSAGWLVALVFSIINAFSAHQTNKLRGEINTIERQNEAQAHEISALVRTNNYLFDHLKAPHSPIPRQSSRQGEQHD